MKNTYFFFLLLAFLNQAFSQDIQELKLTKDGVIPVELNFGDLTTNQIYDRTLMWIQEDYVNPKDVFKENIENEKIKLDGFAKKAWWYKSMGLKNYNHMQYSVVIIFNENKVIFEFIVGDFYILEGPKAQYDYRMFFNKDGNVRNQYIDAVPSLELTMNTILLSFYNYVNGSNIQVETKDLNKYLTSLQTSLSKDSTNPTTHFDLACFYSLIEDRDNAYKHLSNAVAFGYSKIDNIHTAPDLKWLRSQNDFKQFVANGYKFIETPQVTTKTTATSNYIEELKELAKLKEEGIITEEEFNTLKAKIIERAKN
jgi:hypothetical protein